jgi:hypothetical protein
MLHQCHSHIVSLQLLGRGMGGRLLSSWNLRSLIQKSQHFGIVKQLPLKLPIKAKGRREIKSKAHAHLNNQTEFLILSRKKSQPKSHKIHIRIQLLQGGKIKLDLFWYWLLWHGWEGSMDRGTLLGGDIFQVQPQAESINNWEKTSVLSHERFTCFHLHNWSFGILQQRLM